MTRRSAPWALVRRDTGVTFLIGQGSPFGDDSLSVGEVLVLYPDQFIEWLSHAYTHGHLDNSHVQALGQHAEPNEWRRVSFDQQPTGKPGESLITATAPGADGVPTPVLGLFRRGRAVREEPVQVVAPDPAPEEEGT